MSDKRLPGVPSAAVADAAPNELTLALAYWLNVIKDERGLSLRGFAAETGLSHSYCARILRGYSNVGLGMLAVIARQLGVKPADLLQPPPDASQEREHSP